MPHPKINQFSTLTAQIIESSTVATDVKKITLHIPHMPKGQPGQFMGIRIADKVDPAYRSYSYYNGETPDTAVLFVKKVVGGRGSTYLHEQEPGSTLTVLMPLGYFGFPDTLGSHTVFIATGTGIVPIMSLLQGVPSSYKGTIEVLFGVRQESDIFAQSEIQQLLPKGAHYTLTLSQASTSWEGKRGRVTSHIKDTYPRDTLIFLCGTGAMLDEVSTLFQQKGLSKKQIFLEDFQQ